MTTASLRVVAPGPLVGELEIVHIGGDHLSIVDEPFISKVGADLTKRMTNLGD